MDDLTDARRALKQGADPNKRMMNWNLSAVHVAAQHGRTLVLLLLLSGGGADPNNVNAFGGTTPFNWACKNDHYDCVRVLLALGAHPDHHWTCKCPSDIAEGFGEKREAFRKTLNEKDLWRLDNYSQGHLS